MVSIQLVGFVLQSDEDWMSSDVHHQHYLEDCVEEHVCRVTAAVLSLVSLHTEGISLS